MPKGRMDFLKKLDADKFANRMKHLGYKIKRGVRKPYGQKVYHVIWKWKKK